MGGYFSSVSQQHFGRDLKRVRPPITFIKNPMKLNCTLKTGLGGIMLLAHFNLAQLPCLAQRDDFNSGTDSPNWFQYDPLAAAGAPVGTWSFPGGNTYRIQSSPSPNPTVLGPGRAGSIRIDMDYTDFYVCVDIVNWDSSLDQNFGILARLTQVGLGTTDGYAMTYQVADQDLAITAFTNEDPDLPGRVGPLGSVTLVPGFSYRFAFLGQGQQLTARVYQLPNLDVPLTEITGTDANFNAGECGLIAFSEANVNTDVTFDNYLASDVEPPKLSIDLSSFGDLTVSWSTNATGYVLQGASVLDSLSWTNLPGPYPVVGDQFTWIGTDTFTEFTKYYRLFRP